MELDNNNHSVFLMYYHLVLVVKYQKTVINEAISDRLKEIFEYISPNYNITLQEWNYDKDHVHILLKAHPNTELSKFINVVKFEEAMVEPEGADNTVIWSSRNEATATVVDGVVTPLSPGAAVISATTGDGGFVAECNVTVRALEGWTLTKTADPLTLTLGRGESKTIEYTVITTNRDSEAGTMLLDYYLELNGFKAMWSEAVDGVLSIAGFEFTRVPEYSGPLTPPDHMEGGTQSYYVTVKNISAVHDETFGLVNEASLSAGDALVDAVTVTTVITTPGELPRTGGYPYYTLGYWL